MREILYRGKRKDNDEWVVGNGIQQGMGHIAYERWVDICDDKVRYEVYPETVGQYTGLKDKYGTMIFEGDIVLYSWLSFGELPFCIEFIDGEFCATPLRQTDDLWQIRISGENLNFEVIGNIHDNPELLKE